MLIIRSNQNSLDLHKPCSTFHKVDLRTKYPHLLKDASYKEAHPRAQKLKNWPLGSWKQCAAQMSPHSDPFCLLIRLLLGPPWWVPKQQKAPGRVSLGAGAWQEFPADTQCEALFRINWTDSLKDRCGYGSLILLQLPTKMKPFYEISLWSSKTSSCSLWSRSK